MNLGVQYYRAPFPQQKYWDEDFSRIRDAGFNTVQLWVLWAWVEPKPGKFLFDDYDQLVALADRKGLNVVLSNIAEIQPLWIHREVPGSGLVNQDGHKVVSSQRLECHFGLTPGGCTDHPGVWERMARFLETVTRRYATASNLVGWDAWNELRWNVHSDGFVCYCEHTLREFRDWLDMRFGGLDGLNDAWLRRYGAWDEVTPGKHVSRPFTEMMAFTHFLTWRACQHARARFEVMRRVDRVHPITVHAADPAPLEAGGLFPVKPMATECNQPINRGNDWFFAEDLDGIGCSSFPKWGNIDDTTFQVRLKYIQSAAGRKHIWLSELQGSAAATENSIHIPVDPRSQQRWVWQGIASGANTILFWCWRDEVFGREAGGFGISGADGYAEQRLAGMRRTGDHLERISPHIADYRGELGEVGVLFSPQSYYLTFSQEGTSDWSKEALQNYCRALSRLCVPYRVFEEEHLDDLASVKVLFMPRVEVLDPDTERLLEHFVRGGGTIFMESGGGAFDSRGIWRYAEDRLGARLTNIRDMGRRRLVADKITAYMGEKPVELGLFQWMTPLSADAGAVLAPHDDNGRATSLLSRAEVAQGVVYLAGSYLGNGVRPDTRAGFDAMVSAIIDAAGVRRPVRILEPDLVDSFFQIGLGESGGRRVLFLFAPEGVDRVTLQLEPGLFKGAIRELLGDTVYTQQGDRLEVVLPPENWGIGILVED